jgi:4-hydroxy-tetrahydrodipicolinate synthase
MISWKGVMPAITTAFDDSLQIDHAALARHCQRMADGGCTGIVALGSLGEGATLSFDEKLAVLRTCKDTLGSRIPLIAGIAALSTAEAVKLAQAAHLAGCSGLMLLPPYVYKGDWRETRAHVGAVLEASDLPSMLYNNPIAYGTDFTPEQIRDLAESFPHLEAVKESSADVRRVTAIRALIEDRLAVFMGVDDLIVEGVAAGAVGWIAGLANAFPRESVALFDLAMRQDWAAAHDVYRWFLPLLRLDTVPKFVQLIKAVQEELGMGSARVRPPRLELTENERLEVKAMVAAALQNRPQIVQLS